MTERIFECIDQQGPGKLQAGHNGLQELTLRSPAGVASPATNIPAH